MVISAKRSQNRKIVRKVLDTGMKSQALGAGRGDIILEHATAKKTECLTVGLHSFLARKRLWCGNFTFMDSDTQIGNVTCLVVANLV